MPLPSWIRLSTGVPARADLAAVSTPLADVLANVAAENAPLRIVYGRAQVGAQIANVLVHGGRLIVQAVWCEGEIDAVESVSINNEALPAGVTATHYTGTAGQTVNATLVAAFAAQGIVYADALPGIAYSVVSIPATDSAGFPELVATIRGRKVFDTRTSTVAWSDNPALCLADFIASPAYGLGLPVDAASVTAVANDNDALLGGLNRRRLGLVIDSVAPTRQHIEALRAYAGCWVIDSGAGLKLVSDRPRATDHTVTAADVIAGTFRLRQLGVADLPTVVHVTWTDTTTTPWSEKTATAYAPGVGDGTTPRRESTVPLPGIQTYAQGLREAIERVNHFSLENIEAEWDAFDEALAYEKGDVVSVTHPVGLTGKLMRITDVRPSGPGRFRVTAREYDSAAYSDAIASEPSSPDTALPSPAAPPVPTGLVAAEEVYQLENGTFASRLRATWDAADYPYLAHCRVEIRAGANLIQAGSAPGTEWASPAVQEGVTYTVRVAAVTAIGAASDWASTAVTAQGKYLIPGDVPWITFFEANGRSYLSWGQAADIDIWRYRLKYGPVGGDYASAIELDLIDGLRYQTGDIPAGTWVIYCKAVDSVRQESPNAATVTGTVTLDSDAYLVDSHDHTSPSVSGMAEYSLGPWDATRRWVTEDGRTAAAKFPDVAATYDQIAATYHDGSASAWWGEPEDFGLSLSGTWTGMGAFDLLAGAGSSHIETSDDASTWRQAVSTSDLDTARFARLRHKSASGVIRVALGAADLQQVRLAAIPRSFEGDATSSASGPVTITLPQQLAKFTAITVQPLASAAMIGVPDNLTLGDPTTFDAYVFDTAGNKVAAAFKWTAKGVG